MCLLVSYVRMIRRNWFKANYAPGPCGTQEISMREECPYWIDIMVAEERIGRKEERVQQEDRRRVCCAGPAEPPAGQMGGPPRMGGGGSHNE